ncbi:HIT domain protein [Alteracholeplasma palmae J233]|uniref:HIT domain protein n=1 Tax=Alteracholeplasma palmae (strain ATCC 49389 / J233) TaxID=1318466 RepID=U4KL47_ALTPJ|nr:HIT family protein [Alteracholeplasma palmae]CCV64604.1 HIT domain protein [Alteracholeplasma palmae J233]
MCLLCERIQQIKDNKNPYFVKELETGYVVIGDHQRFYGYTLFLSKTHVTELHLLEKKTREKYLLEMALVSEACYKAFKADKMNIESLGNGDAHLHFHLFPRKQGDMPIKGPVWWVPKEEMYDESQRPSMKELEKLKHQLKNELDKLLKERSQ